jgi:hypothetical protein
VSAATDHHAVASALRLRASGAWRTLAQLRALGSDSGNTTIDALLSGLCTSSLDPAALGRDDLYRLGQLAPRSACALALSRSLLALAQERILAGQAETARTPLRQALAYSLNAATEAGVPVASELHDLVLHQADDLWGALMSQLDLALAGQQSALPSQLALVLGMHRSGTSAFTGLLVQAGLDAPRDLMQPTDRNPKGYFESLGVMRINEQLLQDLGSSWCDAWNLSGSCWQRHAEAGQRWRSSLLQVLQSNYPLGGRPILKDPRLCVLMPALGPWLESGLLNVVCFLPIRHPAEVVASLEAAEQTPQATGLLLWLAHVFQAERYSRGFERVIVNYAHLLEQPAEVVQRCEQALEQSVNSPIKPLSWNPDAQEFIDPSLKHQHMGAKAEPAAWLQDQAENYFELASRVYNLMINPDLDPATLAARMDQLRWQWSCMAP